MRTPLKMVLVTDGTSDRVLAPIIEWAVRQIDSEAQFAPWTFRPRSPISRPLAEFVDEVNRDYVPDLLFVHRDAEKESHDIRMVEIPEYDPIVPIVPVRMTEAWLLISEEAIRKAAGNPNGTVPVVLPRLTQLEGLPDPKRVLTDLLKLASGKRGRRLDQFDRVAAARRVVDYIDDFSVLRALSAFASFEQCLQDRWQQKQHYKDV